VTTILDRQAELHPFAGPSHWNDPDMLEVGNGSLSESEGRAHFALWAMLAAPLMAGNDLRTMADEVRAILTAPEIVALDQDRRGAQGRRVRHDMNGDVWVRELDAPGTRAVAILNRGSSENEMRVGLDELGLAPDARVRVRDLWQRSDVGECRREIVTTVSAHSAAVLSLTTY
jgi:alpha-galactosidase